MSMQLLRSGKNKMQETNLFIAKMKVLPHFCRENKIIRFTQ
jgi:hypothetical protein